MRKVLALTWMILSAVPDSAVAYCIDHTYLVQPGEIRDILEEQHSQCEQLQRLQYDIDDIKDDIDDIKQVLEAIKKTLKDPPVEAGTGGRR
jgi:peptidoglycan hydrolase CwlO-like protein